MDTCGYRIYRDDAAYYLGHIEYITESLCGENIECFDECYQSWLFCPYCGKRFLNPAHTQEGGTIG